MIAIDSSVLIDLLADGPAADAAEACLRQALSTGPVVVSDITLAEICTALQNGADALDALEDMGVAFSATEAKAAVRAGEMQRRHRQRAAQVAANCAAIGASTGLATPAGRSLSDFLVGAHALLQCDALITRDDSFYREYFKGLKVIVPKVA